MPFQGNVSQHDNAVKFIDQEDLQMVIITIAAFHIRKTLQDDVFSNYPQTDYAPFITDL